MKTLDSVQIFVELSPSDKIRFLSRLGLELTIVGRDAYQPQTDQLTHPARLRAVNEIQHRLFSHLYCLASDVADRYPDDVLIAIILEEWPDRVLNAEVQHAFDRAAEFVQSNPI